jgi:rhamnose utilization protein RhaD (predicted bifunctional aldolase and dehydrogenase)
VTELEILAGLSREFGTDRYVKGGGGNTSFKNSETLWIKPSGLALPDMLPETFVPLDRGRLGKLYDTPTPTDPSERETLVKNMMEAAVVGDSGARASVESPLHDSFDAAYVVHTHPALVTAMLCSQQAESVCRRLFPESLWMGYVDPGYTLCMAARAALAEYASEHGRQPAVVFMKNHGLFVAGDSADAIRSEYGHVMQTLEDAYAAVGVRMDVPVGPVPSAEEVADVQTRLDAAMVGESVSVAASGRFSVPEGPLSPDHIVYAKSYAFFDDLTPEALLTFKEEQGYWPRVVVTENAVYGVGDSQRSADLALLLSEDGAQAMQLKTAFGGPEYMDDRARHFIENWEVEAYRKKVAGV